MNEQDIVKKLRTSGQVQLPPERAQKIRQAILAEVQPVTTGDPGRYTQQKRFYQLIPKPMIAAAIASIIIALGLGTTTVANAARPGDLLYGWDTATERLRLALTLSQEGKATYEAQRAEERLQEQLDLEAKNSDHAAEAAVHAGVALDQAILSVGAARLKLEDRSGKGFEALTKVEARLRELRDRHEADESQLQVEAETESGKTKVHVEFDQNRWEWTTTVTEREALIAEIATRTGLLADDIRAVLKLEISGSDENDDQDDDSVNNNRNRNTNTTTNSSTNRNTNAGNDDSEDDSRGANSNTNRATTNVNANDDDSEDEDAQAIRVRVHLEDGTTEIRATVNGREQEWELNTVTEATIIASIAAKTGLSSAVITSTWDFERR